MKTNDATKEFDRFEVLTRRIVSVPKKDIKEREEKEKASKTGTVKKRSLEVNNVSRVLHYMTKQLTQEQIEGLQSGTSVTLERGVIYQVTEDLVIHPATQVEY